MKTLSLVLVAAVFFSRAGFAQEVTVRSLIAEKREELRNEQEEMAKSKEELKKMRAMLEGYNSDDRRATAMLLGGVAGIGATFVVEVMSPLRIRLSPRAGVVTALAYVGSTALMLVGGVKGYVTSRKIEKLKNAIDKAETAIEQYETKIKADQASLDALEKELRK